MTDNTLLVASDARVYANSPDTNYGGLSKLSVNETPNRRQSMLYFNQPFPLGVTIISATLRLHQKGAATGGSRTLTIQRNSTAWVESKVTYNSRPLGTGATATATQSNSSVDGREWDFNVTALMQEVADGAAWYGFRLTSTNTTLLDLYAKEGGGLFAPVLEVQWSDAPAAPTQLAPAAARAISVARPTLRFDFNDPTGESVLTQIQVQLNTSNSFTSPAIDSGQIAADLPQWALTSDLTSGTTYYWRARVADAAGLWSDWSETAVFARTAKPTVAITNPDVSPSNIIYESTPTFSWTVTGTTQESFQLILVDPDNPTTVLWTSTKITSAATSMALPDDQKLLLTPGGSYRLVLRIWDTVARESIPEETPYVEVDRDFMFGTTGAVTGVTSLGVTIVDGSPFAVLQFDRTSDPESFVITDNGKTIAVVDPADVFVSGTTYRVEVRLVVPLVTHTWGVAARVGTQTSDLATTTGATAPEGLWLYELDGDAAICIWSDDPITAEASEDTAVHLPVGSPNAVLITQALRGPDGAVTGDVEIVDVADWNTIAARRGVNVGLTISDQAKQVQIYNTVRNRQHEFVDKFPISFSYVEQI